MQQMLKVTNIKQQLTDISYTSFYFEEPYRITGAKCNYSDIPIRLANIGMIEISSPSGGPLNY